MNVQVHTYMNKEQAQSPFQLAVSICLHSSLRNRHAGWVQRKGREISREKRVCLSELTHCPGCWRRRVKANIILYQSASKWPLRTSLCPLPLPRDVRRPSALGCTAGPATERVTGKAFLALLICWAVVHAFLPEKCGSH